MKPTRDQLHVAIAEAERMREAGEDPNHLASSLLYLNHRRAMLEKVYEAAERYVKFGMDEGEHKTLLKALDEARQAEWKDSGESADELGLTSSP